MICKVIFAVVLCFAVSEAYAASTMQKERTLTKREDTPLIPCMGNTPCGWAVYHRFTRDIDYYMKNKCKCPDEKKCLRTDDDISVTAFVYRCRRPDDPDVIKT